MPLNPWQYDLVLNAEAQSNNSTTKIIDLPRDGHISLIDLVFACTNGATSNAGYSNGGTAGSRLEDSIDRIQIIANGSKTILDVTSVEDLIAEAIRITGKAPARTITEAASGVQSLHVPIYMGRFPDDKTVILPNGKRTGENGQFFDSLQLKIQYSPTIAATDFATGTFTITCGVKKLVDNSPPETKLVKLFRQKEQYTTVASGDKNFPLTYGANIFLRAVQMYCYEIAIEEGVDITTLELLYNTKGSGTQSYGKWLWTLLQRHNAQIYNIGDLMWTGRALCSDTDVIATHVPSPEYFQAKGELYTITNALGTLTVVESRAGDSLTLGMFSQADAAAAAYTTDQAVYWIVKASVIPAYVYIDFDESRSMIDLLDTGKVSEITLKATNGGAGGTVRINEEHIMTAKDFRAV